ncbi:hypothetical protein J2Z72_000510 [Peptostreptococcus canis]|nr:hypothetical protein [Peptostreptococcus canis]
MRIDLVGAFKYILLIVVEYISMYLRWAND